MVPKEARGGEIHGKSNDDSHRSHGLKRKISDPFPLDLTLYILSRLPPKSLVRSLCVSKLWSSTLPSLINSFANLSSARPSLLLTFHEGNQRFVFSFPQHQNPDGSYPPVDSYQIMTNPKDWSFTQQESVHGLIFLRDLRIWNPTMRRSFDLPKPKSSFMSGLYHLAYEPLEGKHKVLYISHKDSENPLVLALGSSACETWRKTKDYCPLHFPTHSAKCIKGVLYYKAYFGVDMSCYAIMSFDARSEKFKMIKFPEDYIFGPIMVTYEGKLALVTTNYFSISDSVDLWILKDAGRHEWKRKHFILPLCKADLVWKTGLKLIGITEAGELIYAPQTLSESVYILYVDLRSNNIRETLFEGILGYEFRRSNRLEDHLIIRDIGIFPNHINSLVTW